MSDQRSVFLQSVEQSLISILSPDEVKEVTDKIAIVLNDYEITEKYDKIVPLDLGNEKIIKRYSACLLIEGKSEKTVFQYSRSIRNLSEFIQKPFTEMRPYDIRYYMASEKQRGISDRSLENTRANLSAFFTWMVREEEMPFSPMQVIRPVKYAQEIRKPFSDVEIDRLRSACKNAKERALVEVLLATGVRVSELSDMELCDIDEKSLRVEVRHGKGGDSRTTYITPVAMQHLEIYISSRPEGEKVYVFYNRGREKLLPTGIRYILNTIGERAEVDTVHPHRFRRTFATKLASRGMDIQAIQKLLGHKNLNTTLEYVCTDDESVNSSYRKYIA